MSALDGLAMRVTRPYREEDVAAMMEIWNAVVEAGRALDRKSVV